MGAVGSECGQRPSPHGDKAVAAGQMEKGCELLEGAASWGDWQRQHARRAAEAHRRRADDAPSVGSDLDGAPGFVGEIKIDVAGMLRQANTDFPLGTLKLSLRLKQIEG